MRRAAVGGARARIKRLVHDQTEYHAVYFTYSTHAIDGAHSTVTCVAVQALRFYGAFFVSLRLESYILYVFVC